MTFRYLASLSFLFSTTGVSAAVAQQGGELTGDSPRLAGLAGAGLAGGEDLAEAVHNPAMLGFVKLDPGQWQFDTSLRGVSNPIEGTDRIGRSFSSSGHPALAPFLAIGMRPSRDWAWSFQVLPTSGGSTSFSRWTKLDIAADETEPGSGVFEPRDRLIEIDNEVVQIGLVPSLAWTPAPGLALGIGLSLRDTALSLSSATELDLDTMQGAPPPSLEGLGATWGEVFKTLGSLGGRDLTQFQVEYDTEADAAIMRMLKFGFAYQDDRGRRFGFWFRPPSNAVDIDGSADIDLEADLGDVIRATFGPDTPTTSSYDLSIADVRFPAQLGFAYFQPLGQRDRLHAQAIWTQWSQTFDGWTAQLTGGSSEIFNDMLDGTGETTLDLDNRWDDSWALSFGWEHDWVWAPAAWARRQLAEHGRLVEGWAVTSRVGLGWSSDPVGGTVVPGLLPSNNWHLGTGISFHDGPGGGAWHVGFVAALPQNIQTGDNSVLSDLSYDVYRQANYALAVGYSLSW
ncbi:MAG: outer membrane protein transport protein [Planctomycetes bacterium]|nr:outer membrane protein transport protein [Planctomycetota bacterium]